MASDPDALLMLAFQRGDQSAFRTLFDRYGRAMVSFCHHFVKDAAVAEELAQDVFLKLHRTAARYTPTARFKTYLYRIAANHCLNERRRWDFNARVGERDGEEDAGLDRFAGSNATPEEHAQAAALARAVDAMLLRLPDKQRTAFVLCRFEGLGYEEIAQVLGTTVSSVKSLIHRATVTAAEVLAPFTSSVEAPSNAKETAS